MNAQSAGAVDQELEGLLTTAQQRTEQKGVIKKINYSHAAMIDLIIAQPGISQNALAAHFGYTPSWISQVISSDAFQGALAKRKEELVDPALALTVEQGFKALVSRSLDVLQQKLNKPAMEIPDNLALRALEVGSRAAGYGAKDLSQPPASTPAEVHIHLEQLGGGLVALLQRKKREANEVIDVQPVRGANPEAVLSHYVVKDAAGARELAAARQIAQLTNDVSEEH